MIGQKIGLDYGAAVGWFGKECFKETSLFRDGGCRNHSGEII